MYKEVINYKEILDMEEKLNKNISILDYFNDNSKIIRKNAYFIKQGAINNSIGIINYGVLRGYIIDEKGNEINLMFYKENDIIASTLSPNNQSFINIQAIEDSEINTLNFNNSLNLFQTNNKFNKVISDSLEQSHINIQLRLSSFILGNGLKRYELFLKEYPNLLNRVPHFHIANFLGITPTQLSRIRREFANKY